MEKFELFFRQKFQLFVIDFRPEEVSDGINGHQAQRVGGRYHFEAGPWNLLKLKIEVKRNVKEICHLNFFMVLHGSMI
jgi:hypothetical protein